MIGDTEYYFSFNTANNTVALTSGSLPSWMSFSTEVNPNVATQIRVKVVVNDYPARDKNIRIKSNVVSKNYGISTISAQLIASNEGLRISNVGDQRVTSNVAVNSLASEVLSIDGMRG